MPEAADRAAQLKALKAQETQQRSAVAPPPTDEHAARAHFVGATVIDAIVIDPPTPEELVDIQYSENEDRADFSDMERAWALARMKQVLQDAPWEMVEQRFRLSEGRRKQLMRLMAFSEAQQQLVARLRAPETQLRPLHAALREGSLSSAQADRILQQLIARATQQGQGAEVDSDDAAGVVRPAIDGRTVAQLTSRVQRSAAIVPPHPGRSGLIH
jgi:hypothetical protein